MLCFGYLCTSVFVLYFMLIVLGGGGWSTSLRWGGGTPFYRFLWFLRGGLLCRFGDECFICLVSCVWRFFRDSTSAGGGSVARNTSSPVVFVG